MSDPLLDRIMRDVGDAQLLDVLAERLKPSDLQSLLLEVFRRRAPAQPPAHVLAQHRASRFTRPSTVSPRLLLEFDRVAFAVADPLFEPVELAPVSPLGTVSALAPVDQNSVVATIRNSEVVSDATNVLALEGATRRADLRAARRDAEWVRLCASHRLLRAQNFNQPHALAHFRLFGLCTAGRDTGSMRFELAALAEHLVFYLQLFRELNAAGWDLRAPRVALTDITDGRHSARLEAEIMEPLAARFPEARLGLDPTRTAGRGYYEQLCFYVYVADAGGQERSVADGGFTDWTRRLLSNGKERLLISGVGTERLCTLYRAAPSRPEE